MGPKIVLTRVEEDKSIEYIELMVQWGYPTTRVQLKSKVAKTI